MRQQKQQPARKESGRKKITPRVKLPKGITYAALARETGATLSHVRRVCLGERESKKLMTVIERRLRKYEKGIGSN